MAVHYDWNELLRDEAARWLRLHDETLYGLSQAADIQHPTLHRWYHRKHSTLQLDTAQRLCRVLRVGLTPPQ